MQRLLPFLTLLFLVLSGCQSDDPTPDNLPNQPTVSDFPDTKRVDGTNQIITARISVKYSKADASYTANWQTNGTVIKDTVYKEKDPTGADQWLYTTKALIKAPSTTGSFQITATLSVNSQKYTQSKNYEVTPYDYDVYRIGMDKALALERLQDSIKGKALALATDSVSFIYGGNISNYRGPAMFLFKNNILSKIYCVFYPDNGLNTKFLFDKMNEEIKLLHGDPKQTVLINEAQLTNYPSWRDLLAGIQKSEVALSANWNTPRLNIVNKLTTISFNLPDKQDFPAIIQIITDK